MMTREDWWTYSRVENARRDRWQRFMRWLAGQL
jgi:hypothetical protein